ncbi:MAG: 2-succinyl-5-enolpyruvyl-6-hydroxy-3-cyclohexene-1-carboxylic-acid synthase [Bifidobacteriaceae bacterium]|nr:2-succinyl-5-enolpyruvyl-6-hydroxy-3-cyclohexene-1-carboxylic-acid synthase [Bifidobacteriaceae bacterium]
MSGAVEAARALLDGAVAAGLRRAVFAPGSRSAPLVYAAVEAAERGQIKLTVRTDERVAAFTALGLAAASGEPVAVVTTSGTATANLHPAVMEAAASRWPLIAITADRPAELHGVGANQTADQRGLFGAAPVWSQTMAAGAARRALREAGAAAVAAALGRRSGRPGPAHINIQFREPLVPTADQPGLGASGAGWPVPGSGDQPSSSAALDSSGWPAPAGAELLPIELGQAGRTVVIAGHGAGPQARQLAEAAGWPLLAEPGSGAWGGPNAVPAGRLVAQLLGHQAERLIVYGRPVLSRPITRLIQEPGIDTVIVHRGGGAWFDLGRRAGRIASAAFLAVGAGGQDRRWLETWLALGQAVWQEIEACPWPTGPAIAAEVAAAGGPLVVAASSAIRDLDLVPAAGANRPATSPAMAPATAPAMAPPAGGPARRLTGTPGQAPRSAAPPEGGEGRADSALTQVWAMRGLAGIDGTVSFAGGVGLALGQPVTALVGDLALAHDAGGLAVPDHERRPDLRIVLLDDSGGAIFENLEVAAPELAPAFERFFATPLTVDWAQLAAAHGAGFERAASLGQLRRALSRPVAGVSLIAVPLQRARRRGFERRIVERFEKRLTAFQRLPSDAGGFIQDQAV